MLELYDGRSPESTESRRVIIGVAQAPGVGARIVDVLVRRATVADIPLCARILSEAFADDPVMTVLWPRPNERHKLLCRYFDASIRYHHIHGCGVALAFDRQGTPVAAADWDPPSRSKQSLLSTIRASPYLIAALRSGLPRAIAVRRVLDRRQPDEPHWYLAHIGTVDSARGRGYASEIMRKRLEAVDQDRLPAYLVSTRTETIPFYRRFGFDVTTEFPLTSGGPVMTGMWRPARSRDTIPR